MRRLGQTQQGLHHLLHLHFVGVAPTGYRRLDLVGRVLHDLATGIDCFDHGNATGLTNRHRRAHVHLKQHALDRHCGDRKLSEQRTQFRLKLGESVMDLVGRRRAHHAQGHGPWRGARGHLEHAIAASGQPRVNTNYEHAYDRSHLPRKSEGPGSKAGSSLSIWIRSLRAETCPTIDTNRLSVHVGVRDELHDHRRKFAGIPKTVWEEHMLGELRLECLATFTFAVDRSVDQARRNRVHSNANDCEVASNRKGHSRNATL